MMDERQGNHVDEAARRGSEIAYLKRKARKSPNNIYYIAAILLVLATAYALWFRAAFAPSVVPAPPGVQISSLLVDRLWIDELPQRDTDKFNFYLFSSEDNFGVNDHAQSLYKHLLEFFYYGGSDTELKFQFPHDRRNAKSAYKVEKVARPKDELDLKLSLTADPQNGGKPTTYYSSTRWSSTDLQSMPPLLRGLPTQRPAGLPAAPAL